MPLPADWQRAHREKRKREGLCGWNGCGERPEPGRYYCATHRELHRLKTRERRNKAKREAGASCST